MSAIKFNSHKDCQSTGTGGEWNGIVDKDILPSKPGINIGSPTQRFDTIYVDDAMLSTNTLYLGDTPVMGTDQDTIVIKADKDQSIAIKTTGVGSTKIISESSVELSTDGQNADVVFQTKGNGARTILSSAYAAEVTAPSINLNGNTKVKGNTHVEQLTVDGNIIVNGESFEINSTTLTVEDNIIEINKGQVGQGVSLGCAGIKIDRGDLPDYMLIFDEADDKLKAGLNGDLKVVATEEFVLNNSSNVDLSDYYNKTETDNKLLLKAETEHAHDEYAIKTETHTKAEVEALIENIVPTDLTNHYNKQEVDAKLLLKANQETTYTKEEVDTIIGTIEPPAESTHVHENMTVVNSLGESANMLTYKGKVVVNSNEYSFRTLPIKKPKSQMTKQEIEGRKLPWLT